MAHSSGTRLLETFRIGGHVRGVLEASKPLYCKHRFAYTYRTAYWNVPIPKNIKLVKALKKTHSYNASYLFPTYETKSQECFYFGCVRCGAALPEAPASSMLSALSSPFTKR